MNKSFNNSSIQVGKNAFNYENLLNIPTITAPQKLSTPSALIPFSKMKYTKDHTEFVHFYEHDAVFKSVIEHPDSFTNDLSSFAGLISPDCSLYRDMSLLLQLENTRRNRSVGAYYQQKGLEVIPNIRWGDERTYKPFITETPIAFLGVEQHSIVSVSTYGCMKRKEDRYYFYEGYIAMLNYLKPEVVLIHGSMPQSIFSDTSNQTKLVHFYDWTTMKHRQVA